MRWLYMQFRHYLPVRRLLACLSLKLYLQWEGEVVVLDGIGRYVIPPGQDAAETIHALRLPENARVVTESTTGNRVLLDMDKIMAEAMHRLERSRP